MCFPQYKTSGNKIFINRLEIFFFFFFREMWWTDKKNNHSVFDKKIERKLEAIQVVFEEQKENVWREWMNLKVWKRLELEKCNAVFVE